MKKLLTLMLAAALALSLVACGGGNKGTELTVDNYEQYLDLNIGVSTGNTSIGYATFVMDSTGTKGGQVDMLYDSLSAKMNLSAKSTNFNYNDVTIKVKVTANYEYCTPPLSSLLVGQADVCEFNLEAKTDIAGNCDVVTDDYNLPEDHFTHSYLIGDVTYEIVEISGTVTPA